MEVSSKSCPKYSTKKKQSKLTEWVESVQKNNNNNKPKLQRQHGVIELREDVPSTAMETIDLLLPKPTPTFFVYNGVEIIADHNLVCVFDKPPDLCKSLVTNCLWDIDYLNDTMNTKSYERVVHFKYKPSLPVYDVWIGIVLQPGWSMSTTFKGNTRVIHATTTSGEVIDLFDQFNKWYKVTREFLNGEIVRVRFTKTNGTHIVRSEEMAIVQCQTTFSSRYAFQQERDNIPFDTLPKGEIIVSNSVIDMDNTKLEESIKESLISFFTPTVVLGDGETIIWQSECVSVNFARSIHPDTRVLPLFIAEKTIFDGLVAKIYKVRNSLEGKQEETLLQTVPLSTSEKTNIDWHIHYETVSWLNDCIIIRLNCTNQWTSTPIFISQ